MKLGIVGKGGTGKTTLSALISKAYVEMELADLVQGESVPLGTLDEPETLERGFVVVAVAAAGPTRFRQQS